MGYDPIMRAPNFVMNGDSAKINLGKEMNITQFSSFTIQLNFTNLDALTDGTFQLLVSNDDANYVPVDDRNGDTYKVRVLGNSQSSYFIFVDATVGGVQYIGLKYTRAAGSGKLATIFVAGNSL